MCAMPFKERTPEEPQRPQVESHKPPRMLGPKFQRFILSTSILLFASLSAGEPVASNVTRSDGAMRVANLTQIARPVESENTKASLVGVRPASASTNFGEQSESSILKGSLLRNLLAERGRVAGPAKEEEEEEEEVTKTIVMPIKEPTEDTAEEGDQQPRTLATNSIRKDQLLNLAQLQQRVQQPRPEASLRLTSTEMNGILNDGEGPEFYRERERSGDGVLVGEEQSRLWTAASTGFGGIGGGHPAVGGMMGPSFEHPLDAGFVNHRLSNAASEAGFHHRFGSSFNGEGDPTGFGQGGRLMQSPNEFNEYQAGPEYGSHSMGAYGGGGSLDYANQMLRAGSGDFGPEANYAAHSGGSFLPAGYQNSPALERHASEFYGPGEGTFPSQSHFPAGGADSLYNGHLLSAGSHIPNQNSFSALQAFGRASDEYASRFGQSGPFEQRGLANQNNLMLRVNSAQAGMASIPSGDFKRGGHDTDMGKLLPLSPIVPIADELVATNHGSYREASNNVEKGASLAKPAAYQKNENKSGQQQPEVYESLEDEADEPDDAGHQSANGEPEDESPTGTGNNLRGRRGSVASLVLNVPPPNADNSIPRSLVDFARVGSAGYLAPQLRKNFEPGNGAGSYRSLKQLIRKNGKIMMQDQHERGSYDPSENPAHIGKYIID